ncbi:hypothetical protein ISP17_03440 [Dyella ginsengisoli]|uniref:HEPN AbiU2-like domain-containing protein n=1 Tax=Dyella ginsengisoli TaxID=363848 RepID=A0ABW8JPF6_9GAMM
MEQQKHGLQVRDEAGDLLLDVGPHVIKSRPAFAEKVGVIAASWSQAEVNLNCLFAALMGTTTELVAEKLEKALSGERASAFAKKIVAKALVGAELESLNEMLDRLDAVRLRRNRVQHDAWAFKPSDSDRLFAIHANDYLDLATRLVAVNEAEDPARAKGAIEAVMAFAANVSSGYTIEELDSIDAEINAVSKSLLQAMLHHIRPGSRKEVGSGP